MLKGIAREKQALIYLSPVPLASYAQRPHHFVEWFHKRFDADVLWLESSPIRLPRMGDIEYVRAWCLKKFSRPRHPGPALSVPWVKEQWLSVKRLSGIPVEPLRIGRYINRLIRSSEMEGVASWAKSYRNCWIVIARPCDAALDLIDRLPDLPCALDVMDLVPAFYSGLSRAWVEAVEKQLAERAELVWVSSAQLQQRFHRFSAKLRLVRNGISPTLVSHLAREPQVHRRFIDTGQCESPLVFGYIGAIADWMDWRLLERCVQVVRENFRKEILIELYGPIQGSLPANLSANIMLKGPVAQHEIGSFLKRFDLGLIPFKQTELTDAVDPIKYYEYRAAGLPVLSASLAEMLSFANDPGLLFFDQLFDTPNLIKALLAQRGVMIQGYAASVSWESRFDRSMFMPLK